jgi:hypothetical protein
MQSFTLAAFGSADGTDPGVSVTVTNANATVAVN